MAFFGNKELGEEPGSYPQPSAPVLEDAEQQNVNESNNASWYPELGQNKSIPPGTMGDPGAISVDQPDNNNNNDDEKKMMEEEEDISVYEMCEGIASVGNIDCIELQREGDMESASMCSSKCVPSFIPNNNGKELDVNDMVKKLNGSVGLFKSKNKRIAAFTEFILSTNKKQRQIVKNHYESKYNQTLQKTIERYDMIHPLIYNPCTLYYV